LRAIEEAFPAEKRPEALGQVLALARSRLREIEYDCLGCEVCFPAIAINALGVEGDACPSEPVEAREGWPPLPGSYTVLRYHAPVAVCTLTDEALMKAIAEAAGPELGIVGTMATENLGIERLILNTVANRNVRFLVLCGEDSRQAVGHVAGASLLARSGVDEGMRIVGAPGKRPVLRNIRREAVEYFRQTVEVVDLIGEKSVTAILKRVVGCGARSPGAAEPFAGSREARAIRGYLPGRMVPDPAGYVVVFPDRARGLLALEHYGNDGVLDVVIEGGSAGEIYWPAIERGLVSRLDHAAYLGRELARAEAALAGASRMFRMRRRSGESRWRFRFVVHQNATVIEMV
jgi:tetrahydromethanopterin S-methyltransferase subunit A